MAKPFDRRSGTLKDSKGKVLRKPKDIAGETANLKWWTVGKKDMAASIAATLKMIRHNQSARMEQLVVSTRLYGSTSAYNLMGTAFTRTSLGSANPSMQRLSYNLCSSVIDTLSSKMAKNKVIPTYITNGGVWKVQKKAKQLTKFTQGLFYQEKVHEKAIESFSDGGVWGDGFVYVYKGGLKGKRKVCIDRTLPHEILIDEIEGCVTDPSQMHRVKYMDRSQALAMFPDLEDNITSVESATYEDIGGMKTAADLIMVVESWHLRSGPEETDGMRVITIGDGVEVDKWDKDYFPFPHFRYSKRKVGWYGQGACERLQNLQGEINRGMITIQKSHHLQSGPKIYLPNGSKIVTQHINNELGAIIHGNEPPIYLIPPIVQQEVYSWVDSLIQKGYDQEGLSKMSTTGEAPMGVDSGKAMRTLNQIGDDRFLFTGQQMEEFVLEIARQAIEVAKEIYEEEGSYEVIFPDTNFMETVDWADIDLDKEEYTLKAFPTSSLSDDLTGRLSEIQEMAQAGMISPRTAKRMMDMPDIEMEEALSNAAEDYLHKILEDMIYDGKYRPPEQFNDLVLAKQLALQYYNYAECNNCPDSKLKLLRRFLSQIDSLSGLNAPMAMAQGAAPSASPMPTPTSNLIPNTASPGVQQ